MMKSLLVLKTAHVSRDIIPLVQSYHPLTRQRRPYSDDAFCVSFHEAYRIVIMRYEALNCVAIAFRYVVTILLSFNGYVGVIFHGDRQC